MRSSRARYVVITTNYYSLLLHQVEGQPALLYIVPTTLGANAARGWWRGEFRSLWSGEAIALPRGGPAATWTADEGASSGAEGVEARGGAESHLLPRGGPIEDRPASARYAQLS